MSTEQILAIQDHAIKTDNRKLLNLAWRALGYDRTVAFMPVSQVEQRAAVHALKEIDK